MAKGVRVKINRFRWGVGVMASPQMREYLGRLGNRVANQIPGSTVKVTSAKTERAGGRRARVIVETPITMAEEAETGEALAALKSVVSTAHRQMLYTTKKGVTRRATQAQIDHWTRGRS